MPSEGKEARAEPVGGDWELVNSTHPGVREDAHTLTFDLKVPANGQTKLKYRVRARWC